MPARTALHVARTLATAPRCMVAAKHSWAVEAALDVLERGGNAVDAAVTAAFGVAVVEPWMSGLGGGGFMTVQLASGERAVIDYFSRAPRRAHDGMYALLPDVRATGVGFGGVEGEANAYGPLSVATPGMVAGMATALERFGTLTLAAALAPAIRFAEHGFPIEWYQGLLIGSEQAVIRRDPETARIFLPDGVPLAPRFGQTALPMLQQPELGRTLRRIAEQGADGFYRGETAERITSHVQSLGGLLQLEDLADYQATVVDPLVIPYRGTELVLLPYQAGGTTIGAAFRILEGFALPTLGHNSAQALHLIVEASRRATADRLAYLGDPDFVEIDWPRLTSAEYAAERRSTIDPRRASQAAPGAGISRRAAPIGGAAAHEGCTTHLSVVDADGTMVSLTQTLTLLFGSAVTVPGTGVLLNDSMNLFDPRPGLPNSVAARKRPASSMAHVIAVRDGRPVLAVGAPGGRRIMDTCLQMALDVLDWQLDIQSACAAPLIDAAGPELLVDDRLPQRTRDALRAMGHAVVDAPVSFAPRQFASPTGVLVDPESGLRHGGADPWALGIAAGR